MNEISINDIAKELMKHETIAIFPHVNIDGDALGSSVALCSALTKKGKDCRIVYDKEIPDNLDFLAGDMLTDGSDLPSEFDLSLMLDCAGSKRIKGREDIFKRGKVKGCIDHHETADTDIQYDFYYCEPLSSATGELVYMLIKALDVKPDLEIANAIFTAITTDSGNFQHSNTTARTHKIAMELYDVEGFNSKPVSALIYDRKPKNIVKLESLVISKLEYLKDGKIAIGTITVKDLEETGAKLSNVDGLVSDILSIEDVVLSALVKEAEDCVKVSLRSLGQVNVAELAQKIGGGGHYNAAGITSHLSVDELKEQLIHLLIEAVE